MLLRYWLGRIGYVASHVSCPASLPSPPTASHPQVKYACILTHTRHYPGTVRPSPPSVSAGRLIFQRAATVRLNARRVRSLLKRFLEFEEAHGTADQQEAVRELARQYVETRSEADAALLDQPAR